MTTTGDVAADLTVPAAGRPNTRRSTGFPLRLTLVIVQTVGIAMTVLGCRALAEGGAFAFLIVLGGVDLIVRPRARRLPSANRIAELVLQCVDRWRR